MKTKVLCIFDGFGLRIKDENNCNALAKMPNFHRILKDYYWITLDADGEAVGQEKGLVGNSEVGHMNIGGLKLVPQLSFQITKSAQSTFKLNPVVAPDQLIDPTVFLKEKFESKYESTNRISKIVHLIGLFSTGSIHSDLRHWAGAIESAGFAGAEKIILHIISDGRDSDRQSLVATWKKFTNTFGDRLKPFEEKIFLGSLGGRFYSMDRDKNWDRVNYGTLAMFNLTFETEVEFEKRFATGNHIHNYGVGFSLIKKPTNLEIISSILRDLTVDSYSKNKFDENIQPTSIKTIKNQGEIIENLQINKGGTIWLLNFRSDRMKQMTTVLCDINKEFNLNLDILAMNDYGLGIEGVDYYPIFKTKTVPNTLAETISKQSKTQLHIAETEKYAHVTFFLNGGLEKKFVGEDWVVIPSNKVNSHAEKPEMKALEITNYILDKGLGKYDYVIVNYANPDMVGHTGDIQAGVKSMEFLDEQLGRLLRGIENGGHSMILTADHGNIEFVGGYKQGELHLTDTEHNASPVPCIIIDKTQTIQEIKNKLLSLDVSNIDEVLKQNNQIDLENQGGNIWLMDNQIPKLQLPLYSVGLMLLEI